ncbi:transposase [uncultured Legionella sp.]
MHQVYRLPLRQSQGFIDSLFRMMGLLCFVIKKL